MYKPKNKIVTTMNGKNTYKPQQHVKADFAMQFSPVNCLIPIDKLPYKIKCFPRQISK